jgi:hypothetical protein
MFHEHLEEEALQNSQATFERVLQTAHTNEQYFVTKYEVSKHIYVYNGWRSIIEQNTCVPFIQTNAETDFLADFSCENQHFDVRFVCDKYKILETNGPSIKLYDSIHEQHCVVYKFFDAISVHFIVEFDITRKKSVEAIENTRINKIVVEIDKQLDFEDENSKGLFEQILSLLLFDEVREAHPHTYNLVRKFC